jgi:hypothetical protein
MAAPVGEVYVRVSLGRSSKRFLIALAGLMSAVEHADPALLEDAVGRAHARLKAEMQGLSFEGGADEAD